MSTDGCTALCRLAVCGDGFAQAGEGCDDGNSSNFDSCTNACQPAACGDTFIGPGESCDDGNQVTEICSYGQFACAVCDSSCITVGGETHYCTDGQLDGVEFCDDGNNNNNDACSNLCVCGADYHDEGGLCALNVQSCTIANGSGTETWDGITYGPCTVASCEAGFHVSGNGCARDVIACTSPNATAATSTWTGTAYGSCIASACTAGFHLESGLCTSDTRSCSPLPANATAGTQLWTGSSYGACTISACAAGYTLTANSCQLIIGDCSNQTNGSQVVISQVFGGGGNMGSVYRNDFIELHNRGNTSVNLNGWSVQYASAAGTSWAVTPLGNVSIAAGGYLLIQEAAGAGGTTSLPTADVTGVIAMSATAGKVILVSSTTAAGLIACPTGATIRDHLSYGSSTACDGATAPTLSAASAAKRNEICASPAFDDTNNNSADFVASAPAPRNSATPASSCSCTGP